MGTNSKCFQIFVASKSSLAQAEDEAVALVQTFGPFDAVFYIFYFIIIFFLMLILSLIMLSARRLWVLEPRSCQSINSVVSRSWTAFWT